MNNLRKLVVAIIIAVPAILFAQSNPLDSFIDKYAGEEGFYYLNLETNMLDVLDEKDGKDADFNHIVNLRMLSYEEGKSTKYEASGIYKDFMVNINKDEYCGLMEVKSNGENVKMMVKKNGNKLSEVIITMQEDDETTLIAASGNFDLKDLAKFGNMEKCKGLKVLGELCED